MRILTVLKAGGEYDWSHVERLRNQCFEFAPGVPFDCLSDDKGLYHDLPGWWSKMEIFRSRGPTLYMDLDTTIKGDLAPLIEAACERRFVVLRDFGRQREVMSSVMAWRGDMSHIYRAFVSNADHWMEKFNTSRWWGDQGFIEWVEKDREYWQDVCPDMLCSYKWHVLKGKEPKDCRIIVYHGKPRPWDA